MQVISPAASTGSEVTPITHPSSEIETSLSSESTTTPRAPSPIQEKTGEKKNSIPFSSPSTTSTSVPNITSPSTSESSSEIISTTSPSTEIGGLFSSESNTTPDISLPIQKGTVKSENLLPFSSPSTTSLSVTNTVSVSASISSPATSLVASSEPIVTIPSVTNTEVDKKEGKLTASQQIAIVADTQLVESGNGWLTSRFWMQKCFQSQQEKKDLKQQLKSSRQTSMLLRQENSQLRQEGEILKQQVKHAERKANYLAGIATQLSNQLSNLFSLFRYPYYAPFPSVVVVHQSPPTPGPFLPHSQTPPGASNVFTRR